MVFRLDGCSFHYAHMWSKSIIYIKRVVKSDITYFTSSVRNLYELPSYISTMIIYLIIKNIVGCLKKCKGYRFYFRLQVIAKGMKIGCKISTRTMIKNIIALIAEST